MQIADDLWQRVAAGELGPRLPSVRAIGSEYDVAHATAAHAVQELVRRGQAITTPGRGTWAVRD
ncbi:GntR family transcriptional regulator [Actinomadura sp. NBRC 104425]|uniref:GntR family transcriptional regulator n=1 Tax=Actinomadura sp. NBRC 104425 TaxID=3032204 RepID=UPI00331DCE1F